MSKIISSIWYSQKARILASQVFLFILVAYLALSLISNLQHNLAVRGITSGFDFLKNTAGFSVIMHLIDYTEQDTYFRAFLVGLLNTLAVASIGVILATVIGVVVGISRLSPNWIVSKLASGYIEFLRNVPLLLQIFFWYFVVLRAAPHPRQAISIGDIVFLTNRGIYLPKAQNTQWLIALLVLLVIVFLVNKIFQAKISQKKPFASQAEKGKKWFKNQTVLIGMVVLAISFAAIMQLQWQKPELRGFNFSGGFVLIPEFLALLLALSLYTASFIAEIVRSGILSIPKGQWEAAKALGLNRKQTMKLIILPQAKRVILPPLTNQYLNLTKNSSLAAAIAYPDLVSVFAGTVLNQTGQAVEIIGITMGVYLIISLSISIIMIKYEKSTRWGQKH